MNIIPVFLLIVQLVGFQLSDGLQIPSCPNNVLGSTCDTVVTLEPAELIDILKTGFSDSISGVKDAENLAMNGFLEASKLISTQPDLALEQLQKTILDSRNQLLESGISFFFSMGRALRLSKFKSRQQLVQGSQQTQFSAVNILGKMRSIQDLENLSIQDIENMRQDIKAGFEEMYEQMHFTLQKASQAMLDVGDALLMSNLKKTENLNAVADDGDVEAIISELIAVSQESILNGADASKVELLKNSLVSSVVDIAEIESYSIEIYSNSSVLADTNPSLAENLIQENSETIYKKIQEIFTNICLEFGSVSEDISGKRIGKAFVAVESGIDDVTSAINMAKKILLDALPNEKNIRETMVKRAINIAEEGVVDFLRNVVKGAKIIFADL